MKTKLINCLQGKEESFEDYTKKLQNEINGGEAISTMQPVLHQTSASNGRLNTMIQFTVQKRDL